MVSQRVMLLTDTAIFYFLFFYFSFFLFIFLFYFILFYFILFFCHYCLTEGSNKWLFLLLSHGWPVGF